MPRNIPSAMLAQIANRQMSPVLFAVIPWGSSTQAVWSGAGTLTTGVPAPAHEWDFSIDEQVQPDLFGTDNMTCGKWGFLGATTITWNPLLFFSSEPSAWALFNGTNSYASDNLSYKMNYERTQAFSVSFFVLQTATTGTQAIIGNLSTSQMTGWEIGIAGGQIYCILTSHFGAGNFFEAVAPAILSTIGHHVVVTYDGSSSAVGVEIYVDGVAQALSVMGNNLTGSIIPAGASCVIGCRNAGTNFLNGYLGFVQYYTVALSGSQVSELFSRIANTTRKSGYSSLQTYIGIGQFGTISAINEVSEVNAQGITLTLSGVDPATLADATATVTQGKMAQVMLGFLSGGALVSDPVLLFQGLTDEVEMKCGAETATITLSLESRLSDLQRTMPIKYTDQWQEQRYPGDLCLLSVEKIIDAQLFWGN
jgi:hypothetical protein